MDCGLLPYLACGKQKNQFDDKYRMIEFNIFAVRVTSQKSPLLFKEIQPLKRENVYGVFQSDHVCYKELLVNSKVLQSYFHCSS